MEPKSKTIIENMRLLWTKNRQLFISRHGLYMAARSAAHKYYDE